MWKGRKTRIFIQILMKLREKSSISIQKTWRKYWNYKLQVRRWEGKIEIDSNLQRPRRSFGSFNVITHFQNLIKGMKERNNNALVTVQKYLKGYKYYNKYDKILNQNKLKSVFKNLEFLKKYEIEKNKKFRKLNFEEAMKNHYYKVEINSKSRAEERNEQNILEIKLHTSNSVEILPLNKDLFSIKAPINFSKVNLLEPLFVISDYSNEEEEPNLLRFSEERRLDDCPYNKTLETLKLNKRRSSLIGKTQFGLRQKKLAIY
mmetsp:Transcript_29278/g.25892  ORF Transcript_29278/g.25892 Transcript_29278/m.25892 type:complete len:261 (-) Transcript_29278:120-902(-)